jgi:hypothetical protein
MRCLTVLSRRGIGLAAGLSSLALVAPAVAVPFTWNPSAAVADADGSFTADNITVQEYALVSVAPSGAYTQRGLINLSTFNNSGTRVFLPGLDRTYTLYAAYAATGQQGVGTVAPGPGLQIPGALTSFDYTIYAASGRPTFSVSTGGPSVSGLGTPVAVATGSLLSGRTSLVEDATGGLSQVTTVTDTFSVLDPSFGLAPGGTSALSAAFANTASVLTLASSQDLVIDGGGGNATLAAISLPATPVPEPTSAAVLGGVLAGLAIAATNALTRAPVPSRRKTRN